MRDQLKTLERVLNACILQSVDEGEGKVSVMKDIKEFSLVFGRPKVFSVLTIRMLRPQFARQAATP